MFSRYLAEDKRKEAWEYVNVMLATLTMLLAAVTVFGILFSPAIVRLFASGFAATPGKLELTATLNRVMFPYIFLISLSALSMGVLNSFHRFGAPAFAPVMLNLSIIAFSFAASFFSETAVALAVGVVVGGVLQLAIQIPALVSSGWRPKLRVLWTHPGVRRVGRLMVPVLFGAGVVQVNILVDTQFASYLQEGSVTAIYLADRVMELVLGGYAIAISTAILPLLSRQASERRIADLKSTLNFAMRIILFITVPATVGLIVLRRPVVEVLFQHGDFDAASTTLTAWSLLFFALGLSAFSMVKVIVPAFYALEDTRTPMRIAVIAMLLNVGLNFLFIGPLQNGGPPLATTVAAFFNSAALMIIFRNRYGPIGFRVVLQSLMKFSIAALALGLVALVLIRWPGFYDDAPMTQKVAALGLTIAAAAGTYFVMAYLLGSREGQELRETRSHPEAFSE